MGAATAIAGVAAAATVGGSVAGALKSGPDSPRGSIPPQLEVKLLKELDDLRKGAQSDIDASYKIEKAYNTRLDYVDTVIKGMMPTPAQQKSLRDASFEIATAFGDPKTAKDRGYLSESDFNDLNALKDMQSKVNAGEYIDPALNEKLKSERNAFEQNLRRSNASPDQIVNALNKFDATAKEQMFTRGQELASGNTANTLNRLTTQDTLRKTTAGLIQQNLSNAFTGAQQLGQNAGSRVSVAKNMIDTRADLNNQTTDSFIKASQINWSGRVKDMLDQGYLKTDGSTANGFSSYQQYLDRGSGGGTRGASYTVPSKTGANSAVNLNGPSRDAYISQQAQAQGITPAQYKAKYGIS